MNYILKHALQETYGRAIDENHLNKSLFSAIFGWQFKFKHYADEADAPLVPTENPYLDQSANQLGFINPATHATDLMLEDISLSPSRMRTLAFEGDWISGSARPTESNGRTLTPSEVRALSDAYRVSKFYDNNWYNWIEQALFLPLRLPKNLLKLIIELLPNYLQWTLRITAGKLITTDSNLLEIGVGLLSLALALPFWILANITQSITSPFAAIKQTYQAFRRFNPNSNLCYVLGITAAILRGLFSLTAYAALAIFAFPVLAGPIAASSAAGGQIIAGITAAVTWFGSLPFIASIGPAVASMFTASAVIAGVASSATLAACAVYGSLILAFMKATLRKLSPSYEKPKPANPEAFSSAEVQQGLSRYEHWQLENRSEIRQQNLRDPSSIEPFAGAPNYLSSSGQQPGLEASAPDEEPAMSFHRGPS